jgi:hypothetical protein
MSDYSRVVDVVMGAIGKIGEAERMLSGGPASFYFEKMKIYAEMLFDRAPFKVGSTVRLTRDLNISKEKSPGWWVYRHMLVAGYTGRVLEIDAERYGDGKFRFCALVSLHNPTYMSNWDPARGSLREDEEVARPCHSEVNLWLREGEIEPVQP